MDCIVDSVCSKISVQQRDSLDEEFSADEVKTALFQMSPSKAPGADGFQADFYQKFWDVVGGDFTNLCLECLNHGKSVDFLNQTLICLIPKVRKVERMSEVRPISLYNVVYKCISKAYANRLRLVMDSVISETQSAFVQGRIITDNAMVGFECMYALKHKANGKKGFMSLKLDMSKAYNRVEWSFLGSMMRRMGFSEYWISRIMGCVSSVTYSFILNGNIRGSIKPSNEV